MVWSSSVASCTFTLLSVLLFFFLCAQQYGLWDHKEQVPPSQSIPNTGDGDKDGRRKSQEHEEDGKVCTEYIVNKLDAEMKQHGKVQILIMSAIS